MKACAEDGIPIVSASGFEAGESDMVWRNESGSTEALICFLRDLVWYLKKRRKMKNQCGG